MHATESPAQRHALFLFKSVWYVEPYRSHSHRTNQTQQVVAARVSYCYVVTRVIVLTPARPGRFPIGEPDFKRSTDCERKGEQAERDQ